MKSSFYTRVTIIVIFYLSVKMFFSCVPQNPISFNYNSIRLYGVNNSGEYLINNTEIDTLYSDAVAINLQIADSTEYYYEANNYFINELKNTFSFEKAYATSIAPPPYYPENKVTAINVYSILDLNETIKAGDQLNDCLLFSYDNTFSLYHTNKDVCKYLSGVQDGPSSSVTIILKPAVTNTKAQFKVEVVLDNCTKLIDTTQVFHIIPSKK